jgi:hypothetical protein
VADQAERADAGYGFPEEQAPRRARTAIRSPAAFREELADVEVAGPETGLSVGEVEVPHALEGGADPSCPTAPSAAGGLAAVLTGFGVTIRAGAQRAVSYSSDESPPYPTMIPGAQGSHGSPAAPEQLLALAAAAQVCRQGVGVGEPSRLR